MPPDSTARFSAAGLAHNIFDGANASVTSETAKRARCVSFSFNPSLPTSSSKPWAQAR